MNNEVKQLLLADGQSMPQEGFGLYKITDQSTITSAIKHAYDAGYRLFDTAQLYKNEAEVGNALQELGLSREELFITTKVSEPNQGFKQTITSVKDSLQKLKLDYVNLLLIHWPIERAFFDTWAALEELKKEGLTRSIGVSNYQMIHLQYLATQAHEMPGVRLGVEPSSIIQPSIRSLLTIISLPPRSSSAGICKAGSPSFRSQFMKRESSKILTSMTSY